MNKYLDKSLEQLEGRKLNKPTLNSHLTTEYYYLLSVPLKNLSIEN